MNKEKIINETVQFVKETLNGAEGGHDWFHIERVWKLSKKIYEKEQSGDLFKIELGALLHDIADYKFHNGCEETGPKIAKEFLESMQVDDSIIQHTIDVIKNISFKGKNQESRFSTPEFDIVQDADRLDAIGAIGIARTFNYGGNAGQALYDPTIKGDPNISKEDYVFNKRPTIAHFYEKLLLLKDLMNTKAGKAMAEHRHKYMEDFLEEFYAEWEGQK